MHIGRRFELFLETYPHPDVRRWSGYEMDDHAPRLALGPRV
jgi:hypothetical protein